MLLGNPVSARSWCACFLQAVAITWKMGKEFPLHVIMQAILCLHELHEAACPHKSLPTRTKLIMQICEVTLFTTLLIEPGHSLQICICHDYVNLVLSC